MLLARLGGHPRLWLWWGRGTPQPMVTAALSGGRPRQGPALAALSWLCSALSALMARASPDLLSLADVTVTEDRARGVSWVAP